MKFWNRLKDNTDVPAAQAAVDEAHRDLAATRARRTEVFRVANDLRCLRAENHFGQRLEASMLRRAR